MSDSSCDVREFLHEIVYVASSFFLYLCQKLSFFPYSYYLIVVIWINIEYIYNMQSYIDNNAIVVTFRTNASRSDETFRFQISGALPVGIVSYIFQYIIHEWCSNMSSGLFMLTRLYVFRSPIIIVGHKLHDVFRPSNKCNKCHLILLSVPLRGATRSTELTNIWRWARDMKYNNASYVPVVGSLAEQCYYHVSHYHTSFWTKTSFPSNGNKNEVLWNFTMWKRNDVTRDTKHSRKH